MDATATVLAIREARQQREFVEALADPRAAQAQVFARLLARLRDTRFGQEHGLDRVRTMADFRSAVPIRDHLALSPWIRRIEQRESRVLTPEPVILFNRTSGTTSEPKHVPVTVSWREEMAALMRLWIVRSLRQHPRQLSGHLLTIVSPAHEGLTPGGIPWGALSGLTALRMPALIRRKQALPYEVSLIRDAATRRKVTLLLALGRNLTTIGTPNPTTLLVLASTLAGEAEWLLRTMHDGMSRVEDLDVIEAPGTDPRGVRETLAAACRPVPTRARELTRLLERHDRLTPHLAWPELQLVTCWLGGTAGLRAHELVPWYGEVPKRDLGLLASEGRFTIPDRDEDPAGPPTLHRVLFEFVPEAEADTPEPRTLGIHELEDGQRYLLVTTGSNGLTRYALHDVVEVRGFAGRTPRLAFLRKGSDWTSLTGEKLHVGQVIAAWQEALASRSWQLPPFQLVAHEATGTYRLLVELPTGPDVPSRDQLDRFVRDFDRALRIGNVEYDHKRADGRLEAPELWPMRPGWSGRVADRLFANGVREHQFKWRHLTTRWDPAHDAERLQEGP